MQFLSTARGALAACLLLLFQSPGIRFDSQKNLFLLEGWPGASQLPASRIADVFSISVDVPAVAPDVPAMLGKYRVENGVIVFAPQYPVQPGVRYKAIARIPGAEPIVRIVDIPKPDIKPSAFIQHVYPSASVLPENQLKFYIHFSAPMSRGLSYQHITLLDEDGKKMTQTFLEIGEELWDPEAKRFTLFFDPGRIKRGLVPHNELGTPIHEGKTYTLIIDRGWLDGEGTPMTADFRKTFKVGPPERRLLDIRSWAVRAPKSGTQEPLQVEFPRPLDHAILERQIEIVDESGTPVTGGPVIDQDETRWKFTPAEPWKRGNYLLRAGNELSDLAGNMADRPFEIDLLDEADKPIEKPIRTISITIN